MIGVVSAAADRGVVEEFFQLFKTPWEFHRPDKFYPVLLSTQGSVPAAQARLTLIYGGAQNAYDVEQRVDAETAAPGSVLAFNGKAIPLYGQGRTFLSRDSWIAAEELTGRAFAFSELAAERRTIRVGYDLFGEVRRLLTEGQPAANAGIPALELHIALLRELITSSGIPVVEIPPVPEGHPFMVCLTHDLDHPVLRNHRCDHTMLGFVYRATVGTVLDACRGKRLVRDIGRNLGAVARLPFVYLGMTGDFWAGFDRYTEIEKGLGATYFVIPRKGDPGRNANGTPDSKRASCYDPGEVKPQLARVLASGGEVGLHGIDAWLDSGQGREERQRVVDAIGEAGDGVRMHWLYFDEQSPAVLDRAGFSYDSSVGYRETVGFKAGTAQPYRPFGAQRLFELPMTVMDTALFFPRYLGLGEAEAEEVVRKLADCTEALGGVLTINWHDRSIAPERLWERFYMKLLAGLKRRGAWFPTAAQAVAWFKARRAVTLSIESSADGPAKIRVAGHVEEGTPGYRLRVHRPRGSSNDEGPITSPAFTDIPFRESTEVNFGY